MKNRKISYNKFSIVRMTFLFVLMIILSFFIVQILYKISKESRKQSQIDKEIAALEAEEKRLNLNKKNLSSLLSYVETDDFKEKEAKDKLNLVKEGEQVVLIKEDELRSAPEKEPEEKKTKVLVNRSNYYYWWHYFFGLQED